MSEIYWSRSKMTSRDMLKLALMGERSVYTPKGSYPECPICGKPIYDMPDMHEAIITRGQISGHREQELIYSRFNVVLRHHVCPGGKSSHTPGIGSNDDYLKCVAQIAKYETKECVLGWLSVMENTFKITATHAKFRFIAAMAEAK